jgi:NB-ARC domain
MQRTSCSALRSNDNAADCFSPRNRAPVAGDDDRMGSGLPVVGLLRERQALLNAIRRRESLLLLGPCGSGKTTLVRSVLECELRSEALVHVSQFQPLHNLLVSVARGLLKSGHIAFRRSVKGASATWELWLAGQTSIHLKGLLWNALEAEPTTIVLEGIDGAGHQTYRFLQRLYFAPGMTMVATARDNAHLGELRRLFWDPRKTHHFQALSDADSLQLFEAAADHFGLRDLSLDDFREKVLDSAKGNPGQIVKMCRLAANPMYRSGRCVKFAPLRIDVLMSLL